MNTKVLFSQALLFLALLPASCAPGADSADSSLDNRRQAGTWFPDMDFRIFPVDDSVVGDPDPTTCDAPKVLLESNSGACVADGIYNQGCDICCNPSVERDGCTGYRSAEEYMIAQLDQGSSQLTSIYTVAATSTVLVDFIDYHLRTSPSKSYTTTDRTRLCSAYDRASLYYNRTASVVGPLKPLTVKISYGNTSSELAIRNALLGPRHSLALLQRACQDASTK